MSMPRSAASETPAVDRKRFADDVAYYLALTPRQLPSRYFYDALGSALFDAICRLPWYGVTRAELRLLTAHGRQLLARLPGLTTIIELGTGNGEKLAALVDAGGTVLGTARSSGTSHEALGLEGSMEALAELLQRLNR